MNRQFFAKARVQKEERVGAIRGYPDRAKKGMEKDRSGCPGKRTL